MGRRGKRVRAIMKVVEHFVIALYTQVNNLTQRGLAASADTLLEGSTAAQVWTTWNLANFNIEKRIAAFAKIGRNEIEMMEAHCRSWWESAARD